MKTAEKKTVAAKPAPLFGVEDLRSYLGRKVRLEWVIAGVRQSELGTITKVSTEGKVPSVELLHARRQLTLPPDTREGNKGATRAQQYRRDGMPIGQKVALPIVVPVARIVAVDAL